MKKLGFTAILCVFVLTILGGFLIWYLKSIIEAVFSGGIFIIGHNI